MNVFDSYPQIISYLWGYASTRDITCKDVEVFILKVPMNLFYSKGHGSKPRSLVSAYFGIDIEAVKQTVPASYTLPLLTVPVPFQHVQKQKHILCLF